MPRIAVSGRVARTGNPLNYSPFGLVLWLRADMGITFGATPRASGTTPPVATLGGTLSGQQNGLQIKTDSVAAGTSVGQATVKVSLDNGSTFPITGLATSATPVAIAGTTLTLAYSGGGTFNADNQWDAIVSQWDDQSGLGNHAVQATAANQPIFSLAGFGGFPALVSTGGNMGLATPSITLGAHTMILAMEGVNGAGAGFVLAHAAAAENYMQNTTVPSSRVHRAGVASNRETTASWLRDGVRKTAGRTFDGTHVSHRVYINGADASPTDGSSTGNPGLTTVAGPIYVGNRVGSQGAAGSYHEILVFSAALPADAMLYLHNGILARAPGSI